MHRATHGDLKPGRGNRHVGRDGRAARRGRILPGMPISDTSLRPNPPRRPGHVPAPGDEGSRRHRAAGGQCAGCAPESGLQAPTHHTGHRRSGQRVAPVALGCALPSARTRTALTTSRRYVNDGRPPARSLRRASNSGSIKAHWAPVRSKGGSALAAPQYDQYNRRRAWPWSGRSSPGQRRSRSRPRPPTGSTRRELRTARGWWRHIRIWRRDHVRTPRWRGARTWCGRRSPVARKTSRSCCAACWTPTRPRRPNGRWAGW